MGMNAREIETHRIRHSGAVKAELSTVGVGVYRLVLCKRANIETSRAVVVGASFEARGAAALPPAGQCVRARALAVTDLPFLQLLTRERTALQRLIQGGSENFELKIADAFRIEGSIEEL